MTRKCLIQEALVKAHLTKDIGENSQLMYAGAAIMTSALLNPCCYYVAFTKQEKV